MAFIKLNHNRVNLDQVCFYHGGDYINLIGFGNTVNVPDKEWLSNKLDGFAKSPKSPFVKIEDGARTIHINMNNVQHFRFAHKGMNISFYGHLLQIQNIDAISKILKFAGEEPRYVGRSSDRDGSQRSKDDGGSGDTHTE